VSQLTGLYFDGISARGQPVRLSRERDRLLLDGGGLDLDIPLAQVGLSPRLGRTRRQLMLPGGAVCEVDDDPLLDDWFGTPAHRRANLLARLEAHWGAVLTAFALVIGLSASLAIWGLPWLARHAALQVPAQWVTMLGRGTLSTLDKTLGGGSELPPERALELRREFTALAVSAGVDARFEFRSWKKLGANALALPDGTIAVTDQLVALAGDDRELIAVIAHELGHVHERHALQQVIAGSGVAALVFVLTGDTSGLAQIVIAAPAVLTQMHHSRALETDADRFAFALLARQGEDPVWFARIIRKLEDAHRTKESGDNAAADDTHGWLQSHPASEQRAQLAEQFSKSNPP
jgi:Zn-dependent protease with chaperone function